MQPNEVVIDFETANPVIDLGEVGSTVYSKHWATEILCLGVNAGGTTFLWRSGNNDFRLHRLAANPSMVFIAHNVGFEKDIWRNKMIPEFGFPDIPNHRWHDTMAVAFLRGLPGSLEKLLLALGLPGKDMQGSKLTRSLSSYDRKGYLIKRTPELMLRVYEYCLKDVADEVAVHELLGFLPADERTVWELDQEINERGIKLDLPMLQGAQRIYESVASVLAREFRDLTGVWPSQRDKVLAWLSSQGVELPDLRKERLTELIGDDDVNGMGQCLQEDGTLPAHVRRGLVIRELIGSSSVKKYARMEKCADPDNGRVFRLLQYYGAGTGRWAGRLFNVHNTPRGIVRSRGADGKLVAPECGKVSAAITSGTVAAVEDLGLVRDDGSTAHPIQILASAVRNTVIAEPGNVFLIGDWSNIEARLVLALAAQRDKIALLASGHDVYIDMARTIYHDETLTKADTEKRQTGKNTVLGCGFQMGWDKFRNRYCPKETPIFAKGVVDAYRKDWAPQVPRLWRDLQEAAHAAVQNPGRMFDAAGMGYRVEGGWLVGRCPDGSALYYYRPTLCKQKPRWKDITPEGDVVEREAESWVDTWRYQVPAGKTNEQRIGPSGSWVYVYGGLLTENYVQHMARQILCGALREAKRQGLDV